MAEAKMPEEKNGELDSETKAAIEANNVVSSKAKTGRAAFVWPLALCLCMILACACAFAWLWHDAREKASAERTQIHDLEARKAALRHLLAIEPCAAKNELSAILGEPKPVISKSAPVSDGSVSQNSSHAPVAVAASPGETGGRAAHVSAIEDACVFLVAINEKERKAGTGSGFFVAPGYVLTNRHVVFNGQSKAFVTNKHFPQIAPGEIVAVSGPDADYALLRVPMPNGAKILPFAANAVKTEKVGAWGFPDLIGKNDPAYAKLLRGEDIGATPELSYSEGVISAILDRQPKLVAHTAPISPGNSGGPLLNERGEVVGMNTMITLDEGTYRQASIALAASDLLRFLTEHGVKPTVSGGVK